VFAFQRQPKLVVFWVGYRLAPSGCEVVEMPDARALAGCQRALDSDLNAVSKTHNCE
jgi:hypothetical protein